MCTNCSWLCGKPCFRNSRADCFSGMDCSYHHRSINYPPLSPFLNEVFIKLDDIWGLLGTAAFAFFCFYLLLAVIAAATIFGLRLVFITIHTMK
ncbi:LIMR family protein [Trifolium repens]|nr:LIMR family protein [Trifolium repens]